METKKAADMMYERDVLAYLNLPSLPRKEWDGESSFARGVCKLLMRSGRYAYGVCTFDVDAGDVYPRIVKVFGLEPFVDVEEIYVVPEYMATESDVDDMDLDAESKEAVSAVLADAEELSSVGDEDAILDADDNEWVFDEIHDAEEARAWLKSWNESHKVKGALPKKDETLKLRLLAIRAEMDKEKGICYKPYCVKSRYKDEK